MVHRIFGRQKVAVRVHASVRVAQRHVRTVCAPSRMFTRFFGATVCGGANGRADGVCLFARAQIKKARRFLQRALSAGDYWAAFSSINLA